MEDKKFLSISINEFPTDHFDRSKILKDENLRKIVKIITLKLAINSDSCEIFSGIECCEV